MLTLSNLGHRYRDTWLFRNINLSIERPISVAVMGPSGSGKTTLLAITGGLTSPTEGIVVLERSSSPGLSVSDKDAEPSISWITQTFAAFPNRTVLENVTCPLMLSGMDCQRARDLARYAIESVSLEHVQDEHIRRLSGGEVQRTAIARAIAVAPTHILADEPTSQLDATTTHQVVRALVFDRPPESMIVLATHDPEVASYCDRQFVLSSQGLREAC